MPDLAPPPLLARAVGRLLFRCYRKFYSTGHAVRNVMHLSWLRSGVLAESLGITAMSLFNRYCTWRRTHPMSGGVLPVLRDRVDEFLPLRKDVFGFGLAPLPRSLQLSAGDSLLNRVISPNVRASLPRQPTPHPLTNPVDIKRTSRSRAHNSQQRTGTVPGASCRLNTRSRRDGPLRLEDIP